MFFSHCRTPGRQAFVQRWQRLRPSGALEVAQQCFGTVWPHVETNSGPMVYPAAVIAHWIRESRSFTASNRSAQRVQGEGSTGDTGSRRVTFRLTRRGTAQCSRRAVFGRNTVVKFVFPKVPSWHLHGKDSRSQTIFNVHTHTEPVHRVQSLDSGVQDGRVTAERTGLGVLSPRRSL